MSSSAVALACVFALALYLVGLVALLLRRNGLFIVLGVLLQGMAGALLFTALAALFGDAAGQGMAFVVLSVAVCHAAVGLAAFAGLHRQQRTPNVDDARLLRG
ncbi:MAG: NADH-quinone oxidoreductase subunit K [Myxococcales bacterium]|nr:NADH-quinone oxidoreductase subunit K [Myxococcales bacterium]